MAKKSKSRLTANMKNITEVTSVISHQLKTPLAGIKSALEVLLSGDLGSLNKDQQEYVTLALSSAAKMIGLVKNLLDASRIDEKRMQLTLTKADFGKIVERVIGDLESFARAKNSQIITRIESNLPVLSIDETKIQEVVNNLVFNAIRYTRGKGSIVVAVSKKGGNLLFSCADNGIGMTPSEQKNIFKKFYRSPRVVELATEGSGLGLFISRAIIRQSGGKVWFESKQNQGTTFYFTLPIKPIQ
ncbi:MAG: HAMP domain-containing sensor histidine kinase [Patescibacteria group bacterium]